MTPRRNDLLLARELVEILQPAYAPCPGFRRRCRGTARWKPELGHVPRGFVGALGAVDEVKVVILVAEPGNPLAGESYRGTNQLMKTYRHTFDRLNEGAGPFHRNLKYLLELSALEGVERVDADFGSGLPRLMVQIDAGQGSDSRIVQAIGEDNVQSRVLTASGLTSAVSIMPIRPSSRPTSGRRVTA